MIIIASAINPNPFVVPENPIPIYVMKKHPARPAIAPEMAAALHLNLITLIPTASRAFGFSPAAICHLPIFVNVKYTPTTPAMIIAIIKFNDKIPCESIAISL